MVTVLQNEGKYPFGSISQVWPLKKFVDENEPVSSVQRKFFDEGEPWREARSALAPAISPPRVAREFLPAIAHASKLASRAAGEEYWRGRFDLFLNHAAFDLFTGLAIGSFPNTCVPGEAGEVYEEFVGVTLNMFHTAGLLFNDPFGKMKRSKYGEVAKSFQRSIELADGISQETVELLRRGEGTQFQKDSFMNKLVQRGMDTQAILESVRVVLQAGVDTTGYVFSWLVLNLAQHPDKQQKLREELEQVLNGDDLTEDKIQHLPFLKACIRESHRLTPPTPLSVMKKPTQQLILCGYEIPPNTTVALNGTCYRILTRHCTNIIPSSLVAGIPWDPEYVDSPKEYRPERFLPEAVEARKGTKAALLDHRLLSDPFSGGARMCLGARVAQLEILAFSARLFQDWNIEVEPGQKWTTKTFLLNKADPYPRLKLEWLH